MLPRAHEIAQLCRHWLRPEAAATPRDKVRDALQALGALLGASGAAAVGAGGPGVVATGGLDAEGNAELLSGPDGVVRAAGWLVRFTASDGARQLTVAFRFDDPEPGDELIALVAASGRALLEATAGAAPVEETFGGYEVLAPLGEGGMGRIHLARARESGELVALKRMSGHLAQEPSFLELFSREVQAASKVLHPNVVRILEYGVAGGEAFLVMEYLHGASLARVCDGAARTGVEVPPALTLALALGYCHGLAAAHAAQVVHCDISPQNLFVTFAGEAKVIDFGLARTVQAGERRRERALGKLGYVAPEQLVGTPVDARADVFSLGVVLYQLLGGTGVDAGWRTYAAAGLAPLPDRGLPALASEVMRAVAFDPAERPASAAELASALEQAAARDGVAPLTREAISRYLRDVVGDTEAYQKRLGTGPMTRPGGPDARTARLE